MTITQQNAPATGTREWGNYILESVDMIGYNGRKCYGTHTHVVAAEFIVGIIDEAAELALPHATLGKRYLLLRDDPFNRMQMEAVNRQVTFRAGSPCNSNGQHVSQPTNPLNSDTAHLVTCKKCRTAWAGRLAKLEAQHAAELHAS